MKALVFALAVFVASINALPKIQNAGVLPKSESLVAEIIVTLIEELSQLIRDRNLDPYYLESAEATYVLPIEGILSATGSARSVALNGLSDIRINSVHFDLLTGALNIDITFPKVAGSVGNAAAEVVILGNTLTGEGSGSLVLNEVRVTGRAVVGIGGSGIAIDDIFITLSVASIDSDLYVNIFGYDLSDEFNKFFGVTLPAGLETYDNEISLILEYIARRLIDRFL